MNVTRHNADFALAGLNDACANARSKRTRWPPSKQGRNAMRFVTYQGSWDRSNESRFGSSECASREPYLSAEYPARARTRRRREESVYKNGTNVLLYRNNARTSVMQTTSGISAATASSIAAACTTRAAARASERTSDDKINRTRQMCVVRREQQRSTKVRTANGGGT